ncbi:peptidylprolyl isomerase [Novosphingobium sp. B1]|uniref:peptidylprolyl isomerase n=1 Tax=Novosphingobium sp. B1 TaxID=1938756 RepID=UPI0009D86FA5|nr:peptidylprolyl isomerase [Novosphingobium sp. B1]SMC68565.1 periplasmic chaperone for outer membrane proteins SurA [Novosphingobium sp. B1]
MKSTLNITRKALTRALGSTAMAIAAVSLTVSPVMAQGANAPLNIPANPTMFGKNDPNLRRATAIINGEIVTGTDVEQRLALIVSANQGKIDAEEKERLRMQVLRNLIDETLQIQEAKAADVPAGDAQVEATYERVATQNFGQSPEALEKYLARIGSSSASLKRQIRGELAWQNLLRRNVQPFVNISEGEVQEAMQRLEASKGTEEYRIGEIFLAATDVNKQQVFANAQKIVEQLKGGGSFVAYARQYSEASTAAVGGDLGWIRLAQLPSELSAAAGTMAAGQLAGPIEIRGGFSILYLIDKRQVLTADPRDALLSLKQISIEFPKGTSNETAGKRAAEFAAAVKAIKGCGDAEAQATKIGATVVANDQIKARDLPGALQETLLNLPVGQTTPPFGSIEEGVRVLMLCGRDDPKVSNGPSFDEMMAQMEDDRVNKRAQTYLRDLRRDAVIEYN